MKYLVLGIGYDDQEYMAIHNRWRKHGIGIHLAGTIDEAARELRSKEYVCVAVHSHGGESLQGIIDAMRAVRPVPVIIVSPEYGAGERMRFIQNGAMQYILDTGITERTESSGQDHAPEPDGKDEEPLTIIIDRDLYFCLEYRSVKVRESEINLSPLEFDALYLFLINRKRVLTFETISARVWGEAYIDNTPKTINNLICRLRKKLKIAPDMPDYIKNIHGIGYKFDSQF